MQLLQIRFNYFVTPKTRTADAPKSIKGVRLRPSSLCKISLYFYAVTLPFFDSFFLKLLDIAQPFFLSFALVSPFLIIHYKPSKERLVIRTRIK